MPLEKGKSKAVIGHNIKKEEAAGKPKKQAVAIALHEAGVPKRYRREDGSLGHPGEKEVCEDGECEGEYD